jgi:hypothetical protein
VIRYNKGFFPFDKTNRIEKISLCMIVIFFNLIDILFTRAKHLNDFVISLQVEIWDHDTSLTPGLCILVPVSSQESGRSPICLRGSILSLFLWFVYYILELFFFFILLLQQLQPLIDSVCTCLSSSYFGVV